MKRIVRSINGFLATATMFSAVLLCAGDVNAEPIKIDSAASTIVVQFRQMGVAVDAQFNKIRIDAQFDPADVASARASTVIETASFDFGPGAEEYNAEVQAPDWFDSKQYPTASFEVTGARDDGNNKYGVIGKLTLKGVTKEIAAQFMLTQESGKTILQGQVPISRLEFNIGQGEWKDTAIVEDKVIVKFRIVGTR
ncbi:MAG: YceI family protein [Burkholderiaceae bacterium]